MKTKELWVVYRTQPRGVDEEYFSSYEDAKQYMEAEKLGFFNLRITLSKRVETEVEDWTQ